jgi:hypothetical protein
MNLIGLFSVPGAMITPPASTVILTLGIRYILVPAFMIRIELFLT